jgi:fluoroquinolone transport system permease protein
VRGVSLRVVGPLLRPTARAMRWLPFLAATGFGLTIVAVPSATTVPLGTDALIHLLRASAVCGGLGLAFLLDDPAARSIETVPIPRVLRHAVRVGIIVPAVGTWWAALLLIASTGAEDGLGPPIPVRGVTLEAGAIFAIAFGLAAIGARGAPDGIASTLAAPGLLILAAAMTLLPRRTGLFVGAQDPAWASAHHRWALVLTAAVVGVLLASREPSARGQRCARPSSQCCAGRWRRAGPSIAAGTGSTGRPASRRRRTRRCLPGSNHGIR